VTHLAGGWFYRGAMDTHSITGNYRERRELPFTATSDRHTSVPTRDRLRYYGSVHGDAHGHGPTSIHVYDYAHVPKSEHGVPMTCAQPLAKVCARCLTSAPDGTENVSALSTSLPLGLMAMKFLLGAHQWTGIYWFPPPALGAALDALGAALGGALQPGSGMLV